MVYDICSSLNTVRPDGKNFQEFEKKKDSTSDRMTKSDKIIIAIFASFFWTDSK